MAHRLPTLLTLAAAAAMLTAAAAEAQTTKKVQAARAHHPVVIAEISDATVRATGLRPLTVQKRSFLDPGNAVPVGQATPEYIVASTTQNIPVYRNFNTAFYGESELPGRFDLPPSNPRFNPSSEPRIPLPFDD